MLDVSLFNIGLVEFDHIRYGRNRHAVRVIRDDLVRIQAFFPDEAIDLYFTGDTVGIAVEKLLEALRGLGFYGRVKRRVTRIGDSNVITLQPGRIYRRSSPRRAMSSRPCQLSPMRA